MRTFAAAVTTHLAGDVLTICACVKATLTNGTIYGFTDHVNNVVVDGQTYNASSLGIIATNLRNNSDLAVDNLDMIAYLDDNGITEADILAGLWDFAQIEFFEVNYTSPSDGKIKGPIGNIGQITLGELSITAELRSLSQRLQQNIGQLVSPLCRYNLGDSRCGVNLGNQTISGISKANPGVVTCTGHTFVNGNVVYIASVAGMTQVNGLTFTVANVTTNTFTIGVDTSGYSTYTSGGTASLTAIGTVTSVTSQSVFAASTLAGVDDYWKEGKLTFTGGLNNGIAKDIKTFVDSGGVITLHEPMPYAVAVSDTFTITPGCNKLLKSNAGYDGHCKVKFNNVVNFGGEPTVPGLDFLASGKQ